MDCYKTLLKVQEFIMNYNKLPKHNKITYKYIQYYKKELEKICN